MATPVSSGSPGITAEEKETGDIKGQRNKVTPPNQPNVRDYVPSSSIQLGRVAHLVSRNPVKTLNEWLRFAVHPSLEEYQEPGIARSRS